MKAYRVNQLGGAGEWTEVPTPVPAADQVLLKMAAAGICRTDLEIMDHGVQFAPWIGSYTIGHENVGTVVDVGSGVQGVELGTQVIVAAIGTCGVCRNCSTGHDNYCSDRPAMYGTANDGGLAEYMVARRHDTVPIGALDPIKAAPLGDAGLTAYGAVNSVLPDVGDNGFVVVIGVGGLGSFALQLLRLKSTATIIAVDLPDRLQHATERGAHLTVPSGPDAAAVIDDITHGEGVDAVLDFVGIDSTLQLSADVARSLGKVVLVGTGGGSIPFSFLGGRFGVQYSNHASGTLSELRELVKLTERGLLVVDTVRYSFADLEHGYTDLRKGNIVGRGVLAFD